MSLSVVTAICGAVDISKRFMAETMGSTSEPRQLCVAFNGCTDDEISSVLAADRDRDGPISVTVDPEPTGSAQALNRAVSVATGGVVAILHNDLLVHHLGWDVELERFFQDHPDAGVVGFAGARVLGRDDIYRAPYELARGDVWTSLEDWEAHGRQAAEPVRVAVLDGLAICCRRETFVSLGGFDELIGVHHMYDIDLSLRFLEAGFTNYVIPIRARHVSGQTANGPRYQARFGPDTETHRTAHENFYRKHLNRLPVRV